MQVRPGSDVQGELVVSKRYSLELDLLPELLVVDLVIRRRLSCVGPFLRQSRTPSEPPFMSNYTWDVLRMHPVQAEVFRREFGSLHEFLIARAHGMRKVVNLIKPEKRRTSICARVEHG